jgi:eukaryotic-like serine/threonine-protein kinase
VPADGPSVRSGLPDVRYGTLVGRDFMIQRLLRKGSTSAVYIAEQLSTSGLRAVKILRREYVADDTLFKRFEREAQMAAKIPSEHVTHIIASGVDEKLKAPWIAMELLEGQHLGDHVEERGALGREEVCRIFEQLCHALAAAHKVGIVHRDLKPANVFLGDAKRVGAQSMVKVLDFGVARIVAESLTLTGAPLGTPSWMAPEQTRGESATPKTDVWALGLLGFYMLTGARFWRACLKADNDAAIMREIRDEPVPIASMRALELGVRDRIPKGFDQWFAQCVAREPGERFFTASASYAALARTLSS